MQRPGSQERTVSGRVFRPIVSLYTAPSAKRLGLLDRTPFDEAILNFGDGGGNADKAVGEIDTFFSSHGPFPDKLVTVRVMTPLQAAPVKDLLPRIVAAGRGAITGILVEMVTEEGDVNEVAQILDAAERSAGLASGSIVIKALLETPGAILRAEKIAVASRLSRLVAFYHGHEDLRRELGGPPRHNVNAFVYAIQHTVLVAGDQGLYVVGPVDTRIPAKIDDPAVRAKVEDDLFQRARFMREMCCAGVQAIHDSQLRPYMAGMTMSVEEAQLAVVRANTYFGQAADDRKAVAVNGLMVDSATVGVDLGEIARAVAAGVCGQEVFEHFREHPDIKRYAAD